MNTESIQDKPCYDGVRTLVLGAAGFIGRWVAAAASTGGAELTLTVRDRQDAEPILHRHGVQAGIIEIDLGDAEAVRKLIRRTKPAVTFNLAGYGVDRTERDEATAYRINAQLVRALAETLAQTRAPHEPPPRLIHVGSVAEYGPIDGPLSEECPARPNTLYGKSKLAGTTFLAQHSGRLGIRALTARLFTVYGPGEHPGRLLPSLLDTARSGYALCLTAGSQVRDFTYVQDVAQGLLRLGLCDAPPGTIVNLTRGRPMAVRNFVKIASAVLEIPPHLLKFGTIETHWQEAERLEVSLDRLRRLLGWTPATDVREGIRRTLELERAVEAPAVTGKRS